MNFVYISPNFPHTYWNFCDRLARHGVRVLGIGDAPYDDLAPQLRSALTEYYRVDNMADYDQMYRAVAYFAFHYGKIDWIESNNEFWLEQDARLRTDFNVSTGIHSDHISAFKSKYGMKEFYARAGVPTARIHHVCGLEADREFIAKVGYPIIAKPDVGVGATNTYKISSDDELQAFYEEQPNVPYVMEEFVTGDICSYDAITDSDCQPLFESMTVWPPSVMDIVLQQLDLMYYTTADMPEQLRSRGRATCRAFGAASRFVHLEFFRLTKAKKGLGEVGDFVGLEVNMRPAGGYTPDMMDWAHSTDVYQIWADMVVANKRLLPDSGLHQWCAYASRRDVHTYVHSHDEIIARYGSQMKMCERMPDMMVPQMGNQMYTVTCPSLEATHEFINFVQQQA